MFGAEPHPPYQRPPLSKKLLNGETSGERLTLRGPEFFKDRGIELRTDCRVETIDRGNGRITVPDGETLAYHGLVLATGARPRPVPLAGANLEGVLCLRTLDDAHALAAALGSARRVVVIGGGFIGLEVAATARMSSCDVTVLELQTRLMARAVSPMLSRFFEDLHRERGVTIRTGCGVRGLRGEAGRVVAVETEDCGELAADVVVVGAGILANDDLARASGLACDRGILVDLRSRTDDPHIVAAGDCTVIRLSDGSFRRLESVQGAIEQAKSAAATLLGIERPFRAAPWFWSDQYDIKLQIAGIATDHDRVAVRGTIGNEGFSIFYYRGEELLAVDSVNRLGDHMLARRFLAEDVAPTPEQAADSGFDLKSLARGAGRRA